MLLLHRPSEAEIIQHLLDQRDVSYSYPEVGGTREGLPSGYNVDHQRTRLGAGQSTFEQAKRALQDWKTYPTPLTELCFPDRPLKPGTIVAAMINVGPLWSLNPCRIVYAVDEQSPDTVQRFGFAIGTLPGHAERGEERFLVEWHPDDDSVWYDLLAFSRPQHCLAKCVYPYTRWVQRQFREQSAASMKAACANGVVEAANVCPVSPIA